MVFEKYSTSYMENTWKTLAIAKMLCKNFAAFLPNLLFFCSNVVFP